MNTFLYVTSDHVGLKNHGAGQVTLSEYDTLKTLGDVHIFDLVHFPQFHNKKVDDDDIYMLRKLKETDLSEIKLAHFHAGSFSKSVKLLKENGIRVSYFAAAHNIELSKKAYETYGIPFNYPHLTDPEQWQQYVQGYLDADLVICPSTHSKNIMESYGCKNVKIIPHGVDIPEKVSPLPKHFTVGYLGNCCAPDKGLIYLLQAWKKLDYKDSTLMIGGHDSTSLFFMDLVRVYGGGNIHLRGWVKNVSDFYNNISLYIQPSVTEGFGLEVLEAMAHQRPTLCSKTAGAVDCVLENWSFDTTNVDQLSEKIEQARELIMEPEKEWMRYHSLWSERAKNYTWDKIKLKYIDVWKELLK